MSAGTRRASSSAMGYMESSRRGPIFGATTPVFLAQWSIRRLRLPCRVIEQMRRSNQMPDENSTTQRRLAAKIVAAYVRRNQIAADQLASLISTVHQALTGRGKPAAEAVVERTPAVSIRRSVHHDHVICLDCGWRGQMLRRHIATAHGLSVEQYRTSWNLSADHAMTAPAYSERRSTMAKQLGLGRGGRRGSVGTSEPAAPESPVATPGRRGRPRSSAASA